MTSPHVSVMLKETLELFSDTKLTIFFDGTLGAGGHAEAFLKAHPEIEKYLGCDRDQSALEIAKTNLSSWNEKVEFLHGNFADLDLLLEEKGIEKVDGFFLT